MAFSTWLLPGDDGLSKKRDSPRLQPASTRSMRIPWNGMRRRRIVLALVVVIALYLFVHNIPSDVVPVARRYNPLYGSMASGHSQHQLGRPSYKGQSKHEKISGEIHDEAVRLPNLASTLRTFAGSGFRATVLFILLQPSSAAHLLPLACQMKQRDLNLVHIAIMGRYQTVPEDLMKLNGILPDDCQVSWHDARPDFPLASSERRILASLQQGYSYLYRAIGPSTVIVDDAHFGDGRQLVVLEQIVARTRASLLKLPQSTSRSMPWLSLLEGNSIARLAEVEVDIVVQAYSESAGSLIRLLRSLKNANYVGLRPPRLTIELPSHTDPSLVRFLSRFKWPPGSTDRESRITIRRRIDPMHITPAEAALRALELFYPASNPSHNHVLLLSPDVEVSPGFMHYLMFSILHFRYGQMSSAHTGRIFGISLELPETSIDGIKPFLPSSKSMKSPFMLSQTPNSKAGLYFGDRWMEFHTFLTGRQAHDPQLVKGELKLSNSHPKWTKHALEFMQVRGLYMLYPEFAQDHQEQIVTLHRELQSMPEEFVDAEDDTSIPSASSDQSWLSSGDVLGEEPGVVKLNTDQLSSTPQLLLPAALTGNRTGPNEDVISPLGYMSPYSATGEATEWFETDEISSKQADQFSLTLGGCSSLASRNAKKIGTVEFLFCDSG